LVEPLSLALAAGAYVGAALAKKSADAVISAAYKRIEAYVVGKLGRPARVEDLDAATMQQSGLAADPVVAQFRTEVFERTPALRRAQLVGRVIQRARILWVDDLPENNRSECRLFKALGAEVQQVQSTREGLGAVAKGPWDVVLSDMDRDGVADAGLQLLRQLPRGSPPIIFYVGRVDESRPIPCGAFGIADQPETLLHLVLDVLERYRV
jgi:CheY-like chemotaxis protein